MEYSVRRLTSTDIFTATNLIFYLKQIKQLASESVLYGLGNMVPRLLNFILFPLHTRVFRPEEYGVFTYLMSVVAILNIVYSFGMETSYFRFATKPGANEKHVFNSTQTAVVLISSALSLLFLLNSDGIAGLLGAEGNGRYIIWLTGILFVDSIVAIPFARLRLQKQPVRFAAFRIVNVLVLTGLNLYFLLFNYDPTVGIEYIFWANLIANAFYILFFFPTLISWRPVFDKVLTGQLVRYAFPIMLTGLAGMTNEFFSRVTLEHWLPDNFYPGKSAEHALGVFGACYKFSVFMSLAVQAFRMAGEPFFFSHAANKNSPELFARVNHYFVLVCCFILLAISINVDTLKLLFLQQEEYWQGLSIVPPLLLGYLFLGIYYNLTVWFKLTDKTYYGTIITVGGTLLTILLNFILIPLYGYLGSSFATAGVYGAMALACYILGQKHFPIPYRIATDSLYILLTFILIYVINGIPVPNQALAIGFHLLVLLTYAGIIFLIERKGWQQSL